MDATIGFIQPPCPLVPARDIVRPSGTVFLPKEHGSWSLALEPLAIGLLVAPSWAGGALAGAVLAGFFARRPLKAAFEPAHSARRLVARETLVMWTALAVAGLFEAGVLGGWSALWPLMLALPFGGAFVWFDGRNQARAVAAELAGCAAFAFVPAAVATLAGRPMEVALTLSALAAIRSLPTIITVRSFLRSAKGEPADAGGSVIVSWLAFIVAAWLAVFAFTSTLVTVLAALLFLRSVWLVSPWRPAWSARQLGMTEALIGGLYVTFIAAICPNV
jgi:lysylphosphatidylglycerol synthetase-like protein (DUF2156 family)